MNRHRSFVINHPHHNHHNHPYRNYHRKHRVKRRSSDGKLYRLTPNLHRQFSLSVNPEISSSSSPKGVFPASPRLTRVASSRLCCICSGCPHVSSCPPPNENVVRSSFRQEKPEMFGNYRFWDVEEWRAQIKREKAKREERKALIIVSAVGIIVFICVSYFGTLLFLRVTRLP